MAGPGAAEGRGAVFALRWCSMVERGDAAAIWMALRLFRLAAEVVISGENGGNSERG